MSSFWYKRPILGLGIALGLFAGSAAQATPMDTLSDVLSSYNVFLSGNMGSSANPYTSSSQGAIAVGGDAYFRSFGLATQVGQGGDGLIVGGNLTFQSGTVHGNALVGGNATFPTNYGGATVTGQLRANAIGTAPTQVQGGTTVGGNPVMLDFAAVSAQLLLASQFMDSAEALAQGTAGTMNKPWGNQIVLTGTSTGINFFELTAADLAALGSASFTINAPSGSTAIINVTGTDVRVGAPGNFGFFYNGIDASNVIFNMPEATTLAIRSFDGSIVAPNATVEFLNGRFNGTLVAANLTGRTWQTGNFNNVGFDGALPIVPQLAEVNAPAAVPEPSTLLLLAGGLAAFGYGRLRRRPGAGAA